jgi:hypothetical protein
MDYIFFYRYENGTEGFGFYSDEQEAKDRMKEFKVDTTNSKIKVSFGIALIEDSVSWVD